MRKEGLQLHVAALGRSGVPRSLFLPAMPESTEPPAHKKRMTLQLLVEHGADIDAVDENGMTPLSLAVVGGNVTAIQVLLEMGVTVNATAEPLVYSASSKGNKAVVSLLIELGFDVNAEREGGWTPLHVAAAKGYKAGFELLSTKGQSSTPGMSLGGQR
ncbi:hypothetical protein VTN96DRAFT_7733 [Rasamsonia emersonii]